MVDIGDWQQALASWLGWRAQLVASHQIPKNYELHATVFANGSGNPSLQPAWNRRKANRHRGDGRRHGHARDAPAVLALIAAGTLDVAPVTTRIVPFDDAADALGEDYTKLIFAR